MFYILLIVTNAFVYRLYSYIAKSSLPEQVIEVMFFYVRDCLHVSIHVTGPKSQTIADTWRMVWQENINTIVMLTCLVENGQVQKCHGI